MAPPLTCSGVQEGLGATAFTRMSALVERLKGDGVPVTPITRVPGGGFAIATGPHGMKIELFEANAPDTRRFFVDPETSNPDPGEKRHVDA